MNALSTTELALRTAACRFGREIIERDAEAWNSAGSVPRDYFTSAAEAGLCALLVPRSAGGHGVSVAGMTAVTATLARHCMAATFALVVHNNLAASIATHAAAPLRQRYLPALMLGRRVGAFLLTEPGVGSDAAAITTVAETGDGGWRLRGEKAWITNGVHADTLAVYAQTAPGSGARGIACFVVDAATRGVIRTPPYELLGGHALGTCGFRFDDCLLGSDALMIPPGQAFRAALGGIDLARVNVAAMCAGMLERALGVAISYTGRRRAFGQIIGDFQGLQWLLADCATDLEAARLLAAHAAALLDAGQPAAVAAAHAKKFSTRAALGRIGDCMQTMGAAGLLRSYPLARHLAAAKIAQYLDGATEIQNVVIARALASDYGAESAEAAPE